MKFCVALLIFLSSYFAPILYKWYQSTRFAEMEKGFGGKFEMELFNGKNNFSLWQSMIKDILIQQGLHETLEDTMPDGLNTKWEDQKLRAVSTIRLALAPEINYNVLEENNPKSLWDKLTKMYMSKSLANK